MPRISALALVVAVLLALAPGYAHAHELHPGIPIPFAGDGGMRTPLVALDGDYAIAWMADGSCILNITLKSADLTGEDWLVRNVTVEGHMERQTFAYRLTRAHYYLEVTGQCPWTATLTPLQV